MCSGHKLKHWVSVLYFSHFSFICCPHEFSISRRTVSDLRYKSENALDEILFFLLSPPVISDTSCNCTWCQTQSKQHCCRVSPPSLISTITRISKQKAVWNFQFLNETKQRKSRLLANPDFGSYVPHQQQPLRRNGTKTSCSIHLISQHTEWFSREGKQVSLGNACVRQSSPLGSQSRQ